MPRKEKKKEENEKQGKGSGRERRGVGGKKGRERSKEISRRHQTFLKLPRNMSFTLLFLTYKSPESSHFLGYINLSVIITVLPRCFLTQKCHLFAPTLFSGSIWSPFKFSIVSLPPEILADSASG